VRHRAFLNSKHKLPCLSVCAVAVDLKASKRTQNATGAVVKDNGFIVGLNPEAGSPEGWHWRYNGSP